MAFGLTRDTGPARLGLTPVGFERLEGWDEDPLSAAVPAFLKSCARLLREPASAPVGTDEGLAADWQSLCRRAAALPPGDNAAARQFFRSGFRPVAVADYGAEDGLFTGYYEIELNGSRKRKGRFQTPIYRRPPGLGVGPKLSRAAIEDGTLAGRGLELYWIDDPIDAFFLQVQGSGRVRLRDGRTVRVGYDGQNGLPYVAVGRLLVDRGIMARDKVTMAAIRKWMKDNPKAGAALRRDDPSYVFFREIRGDGPLGAEHVVLTAERSLAVDRSFIPLGTPIWLDARGRYPPNQEVRRLVVAQDTGGAIKGPVRGDLYWGTGETAGDHAGSMNARGHYFLLLPRIVADRLASEAPWR
jgi:membrane-bound lytic murein transglycosylase A